MSARPLRPFPRPRPNPALLAATGILAVLAPLPFVSGLLGPPWAYPAMVFDAITVALVGAALAGFLEAWRGRLPASILATTLYGVFAGTECAAAAFVAAYTNPALAALPSGLLVIPAAAATYVLVQEWLRTMAYATSASPAAVRNAARHLVTVYAGYAGLEALGFLGLFALYGNSCAAGASASQTACSSGQELGGLGTICMAILLPIVVAFSLGQLLEQWRYALIRSAGPPPTGP